MKNNLGVYFALITQINENKYKNTNTYMSRIMTSWKVKSPGAAALFLSFLEISFKYTHKKKLPLLTQLPVNSAHARVVPALTTCTTVTLTFHWYKLCSLQGCVFSLCSTRHFHKGIFRSIVFLVKTLFACIELHCRNKKNKTKKKISKQLLATTGFTQRKESSSDQF